MKILVIKYRNIGDVLLTSALISNLNEKYPDALIDFTVNKGTEEMLTLNPNINKIITYERTYFKSLNIFKRSYKELEFLWLIKKENYDFVINLTNGDRGNLIAWVSNAPIRVGYLNKNWLLRNALSHELPKQNLRHTIETNLDPLRALKIPVTTKKIKIYWSQNDDQFVTNKLMNIEKFIHIHPVSRWLFKCISDHTMAQIIDYCELELGFKVVITASRDKSETLKVDNILALTKSDPINLSGDMSLKQCAALNNKAEMFIGVDTSIMHISASNNVPVLAFFGPSGACHWGPWDNSLMNSGYEKINGFQSMGIHKVFSESRFCQPCGKDGCDGSKVSDCLMSLDIEKIKKHIKEMLNE
jgi:heptosyltransferase III